MNFLFRKTILSLACFLVSLQVFAADHLIQSLSEGACWFETKEDFIKLSSFNDQVSLQMNKEDLLGKLVESLDAEKKQKNKVKNVTQSALILHCSGMGHSFVSKMINEQTQIESCVWFTVKNDSIVVRSVGGIEDDKNEFCDGYKFNEGLVGLGNEADFNWIKEQDTFQDYVESFSKVTNTLVKIKLKPSFIGKEKIVLDELKKIKGIKFTELNKFQHSVGEWAILD